MRIPSRESIIYDSRTGRFFEKEIQALCREEFCAIDEKTGKAIVLSVEEKERIFIDALQAYYYDGREILSDRDFDQLKEDLLWEVGPLSCSGRRPISRHASAVMRAHVVPCFRKTFSFLHVSL